jgi:hypothetical protein
MHEQFRFVVDASSSDWSGILFLILASDSVCMKYVVSLFRHLHSQYLYHYKRKEKKNLQKINFSFKCGPMQALLHHSLAYFIVLFKFSEKKYFFFYFYFSWISAQWTIKHKVIWMCESAEIYVGTNRKITNWINAI